jgi:aminopeptidase N
MFYQGDQPYAEVWKKLPLIMDEAYGFIKTHYGEYPYRHFSFVQGGDGGMEYPMATLMTGNRSLGSIVGTGLHEFLHSWYHGLLGFNESLYYWMDEGFTNYAETVVTNYLRTTGVLPGSADPFIFENDFKNYYVIHTRGIEEPLVTHADHFEYNQAYNFAAYVKGSLFLHQLEYIMGRAAFGKGMLDFYDRWKYKHPDPTDFMHVMEQVSDMELDWFKEYFIHTTKTIDYVIDTVVATPTGTSISLANIGRMPMPIDIAIILDNGEMHTYTIPLDLMRGEKMEFDQDNHVLEVLPDWHWVHPVYEFEVNFPFSRLRQIKIDPERRIADMDRSNNDWPVVTE